MYRVGLLAVLLLAVVAAADATLSCTLDSSRTVDTTDDISVSFKFESIAPVFSGSGLVGFTTSYAYLYESVSSVQWDRPLEFKVTLEHYAPYQSWRIDKYKCVYNNSGNVEVRYYDVLAQKPQRRTTTITFKVPATAAEHSESTSVKVSKPLEDTYCSSTPTVDSWPNCPTTKPDPNKVSVDYKDWRALQVNGHKPGDVVKAYGVNATIPKPWLYGLEPDNMATLSFVRIDDSNVYEPKNAKDVPVSSSVYFYAVGMPKQWGVVKARGAQAPLYAVKPVASRQPPTAFCRPPACVVLAWENRTMWCNQRVTDVQYASLVAVQSGVTMTESAIFMLGEEEGYLGADIRLPFGSIAVPVVLVWWSSGLDSVAVRLADTPYPRVINSPIYYERNAEKGKINGPLRTSIWTRSKIAVAVDGSASSIELGWYSWPVPFYPPQRPRAEISWTIKIELCNSTPTYLRITAPIWITDALKQNHLDISGGRYVDLLHFLYGEPTTYYWGSGDQYGMVSIHTARYYASTTADAAGSVKLYYTTGVDPTNAGALFIPSMPQTVGGGGGGVSPWLVSLAPTTACRSMFCTSLSPEVQGPLPPFPGDRALPNMGYSIMLMYLNKTGRHRVKVYVEDGYIITSRQSINVSRAKNYKLVEIDKEWKPFEAVVVGPGWWVPLRQLDACGSMPVGASSIYATPDWTGPVRITVEDNGANSTYTFYVTNDVGYRITTRTPAPASLTGTPFNMTAYVTLNGLPYYHAAYGYGEGGRLTPPACASTWYDNYPASQLYASGDFWGSFGLAHMPLRLVNIQYIYTKPRLELAEPWRGLVRVRADGPVSGFAFYAKRGGTWVKIGEAAGSCLLVNASRIFPWDPILVLPLVEQVLDAAPGSTVAIWRPETALLFKTWADLVGYPKGARSVLDVVRRC
jgi:hypothetical protein